MSIGDERLIQLADHLEKGRMGHREFDFTHINLGFPYGQRHTCGTSGCAIGEMPIVWPDVWEFVDAGIPTVNMKGQITSNWRDNVEAWFGIDRAQCNLLFMPDDHYLNDFNDENDYSGDNDAIRERHGAIPLPAYAGKEDVIANIRNFVKWRQEHVNTRQAEPLPVL